MKRHHWILFIIQTTIYLLIIFAGKLFDFSYDMELIWYLIAVILYILSIVLTIVIPKNNGKTN